MGTGEETRTTTLATDMQVAGGRRKPNLDVAMKAPILLLSPGFKVSKVSRLTSALRSAS